MCRCGKAPRWICAAAVLLATGSARANLDESAALTQPGPPRETGEVGEADEASDQALTREAVNPTRWTVLVEASLWRLGAGGRIILPTTPDAGAGAETDIDLLGYDSPRLTPMVEAHLRFDDAWRGSVRGYSFDDDQRTLAGLSGQIGAVLYAPEDTLSSSLSLQSLEAELGYSLEHFEGKNRLADGRRMFEARFELVGGLRFTRLDFALEREARAGATFPGLAAQGFKEDFAEPTIGAKLTMELRERFTIDVMIDVGFSVLDNTSTTANIMVGGFWHVTPHVALQIGYRAHQLDFKADGGAGGDFEFTGANQGLLAGLAIKF
jgi:hypothetical protein